MSTIVAPVSLYEVASLLGEKQDVGTVCKSSKINKWAKYKPVRYNSFKALTDDQFKSTNYGLRIPYTNSPYNLITNRANLGWEYLQPYGKGNNVVADDTPYRLTDFNRYMHTAPSIVPILEAQDVVRATTSSIMVKLPFLSQTDTVLKYSDLRAGSNMDANLSTDFYLGVLMQPQNNTSQLYFATNPLPGLGRMLTVNLGLLTTGATYNSLLFASNVPCSSLSGSYPSGTYILLDNNNFVPLRIISSLPASYRITVTGVINRSGTSTYTVEGYVRFESIENRSFTNVLVRVMTSNNPGSTDTANRTQSLDNQNVIAGNAVIVPFTVNNVTFPNAWLYVTATSQGATVNSGNPVLAVMQMQDPY